MQISTLAKIKVTGLGVLKKVEQKRKIMREANHLPLVSICCLTYNHEKFVKESIESILNQDYKNIEIIALNDGSKDNTLSLLEEVLKLSKFPFTLIDQKNSGNIAANLNKLINLSKGEFIMITSLDDKFLSNTIASLVDEFYEEEDLQFVTPASVVLIDDFSNKITADGRNNIAKLNQQNIKISDLLCMERDLAGSFYIQGCLFRRSLIINCGMFDEDMLGDDIVVRTKIFRYMKQNPNMKFKVTNNPVCCYRIHQNNLHKNNERQCEIIYQVLQRYFDGKASRILNDWVKKTIIYNLNHGKIRDAIRLIFWDKKNMAKIKILCNVSPIFIKRLSNSIINLLKIRSFFKKKTRNINLTIFFLKKALLKKKKSIKFIQLETNGDQRGSLISLENNKNIPFKIKRVYYIFNTKPCVKRGFHAHINLRQLIVCVSGNCKILLDDGKEKIEIELNSPDKGILIKPMIWREIYDFSSDCVLMVLADNHYTEDDYIRNYDEFKKLTS